MSETSLSETHPDLITADNLDKLAEYMHAHVPADRIKMDHFATRPDDEVRTRLAENPDSACTAHYLPMRDLVSRAIWSKEEQNIPQCGASACALGWAVICFLDEVKVMQSNHPHDTPLDFEDVGMRFFPALYGGEDSDGEELSDDEINPWWDQVFDANLSDHKPDVIRRLSDLAKELRLG